MITATNKINVDDLVEDTALNVLVYSNTLLNIHNDNSDNKLNMADHSDLYTQLKFFEGDYKDLLSIFIDYLDVFYVHLSHYIRKERFEAAEILKRAMNVELKFILNKVMTSFPTLKEDV